MNARGFVVGRRVSYVWAIWDRPQFRRWSRWLTIGATGALFLERAGTIEVGYTLTVSYVLVVLALVTSAPAVLRGWRILPTWSACCAAALLAAYILALALGHQAQLAGLSRASSSRGPIYLSDLVLGLCILGLIPGLWDNRSLRPLVIAVAVGGALAAAYAIYQWFALRYGLPFGNINNAADSNGVTFGVTQGTGLFGGQRVKGTFVEPHFLAGYLASTIPMGLVTTRWVAGRYRWIVWGGVAMMLVALLLTISAPGWAELALAIPTASLLYVASRGWILPAAAAAMVTVAIWLSVVPALAVPQLIGPIVGRSGGELTVTTAFRTETWRAALRIWAHNPILGAGPGQSSVLLTTAHAVPGRLSSGALISAQGVWAAALLDGGVIALALWLMLLGGAIVFGLRALWRHPTGLRWATVAAGGATVIDALTSGDRLLPREWLVLALMLAAAASHTATHDRSDSD